MLPNFVIIGAQKSASTFVQDCLSEHPEVFLPLGETPFFESPTYEQKNISELTNLFENRNEICLGIKRPSYLCKPEVPKRIKYHLTNAKIIAVLRNPIERAISAYYHYVKGGWLPPLHVNDGLYKLISETSFSSQYKRAAAEVIEFGYYYKYLSSYYNYFDNNQILLLLHEDILSNPLNSIQKIYSFLGVSPSYIPNQLNSRPQKVTYNLTRLQFISLRNHFVSAYDENKTSRLPKQMNLIDKIAAKTITIIDRFILSRLLSNQKPEVSLELRKYLYQIYQSDIEALEKLIARNLYEWKIK